MGRDAYLLGHTVLREENKGTGRLGILLVSVHNHFRIVGASSLALRSARTCIAVEDHIEDPAAALASTSDRHVAGHHFEEVRLELVDFHGGPGCMSADACQLLVETSDIPHKE